MFSDLPFQYWNAVETKFPEIWSQSKGPYLYYLISGEVVLPY